MKNKRIYLSSPHMGDEEFENVKEAFATNWIAPLGPHVNGFEDDLKAHTGYEAAVLSSGTSAIHLSLRLLEVKQGDIVLVSSFTFCATVNPVVYEKATPVFIDSEPNTWNMSPELLEKAIKDYIAQGKKPKAIILVHLYGMPSKMEEILAIANHYDIPIIEDAAEALGSTYKGQQMGSFGEFSIFSFNGNKIITTSGGGAILSKNIELIQKAKFLATQARDEAPYYLHSQIGYNYRLSNVLAGIGRGQMKVLQDRVDARRSVFNLYKKELSEFDFIHFHTEMEGMYSNRWLTCITLETNKISYEDLRLHLEEDNIEARPLWKPMHQQPVYKDAKSYINGVSDSLFNKGMCLPSGSNMSEDDTDRIFSKIKQKLRKV